MEKFNLILSCNHNRRYYECIPTSIKTWKYLFGENVNIHIAIINPNKWEKYKIDKIKKYGSIVHFIDSTLSNEVPISKLARLALACNVEGFNIIHDVDSVILSKNYVDYILKSYSQGKITCVGREVYENTTHNKNFPMGMLSGYNLDFKNTLKLSGNIISDINNMIGFSKSIPSHINGSVNHQGVFSDETFLEKLIEKNNTALYCNHILRDPENKPENTWERNHCLSRLNKGDWYYDKISNKTYEGNLVLPVKENISLLSCIYKKIKEDNINKYDMGIFDVQWGGSGIEKSTYDWFTKNIPEKSTIIEFGGGIVSSYVFGSSYNLHTVEQNSNFVLYEDPTYHFAEIKNNWYDIEKLQNLPKSPDCIFIDGPLGTGNRDGFLKFMDYFDLSKTTIVLHDTYREKEILLAKKISKKINKKVKFLELLDKNGKDFIGVIQ